MVPVGGVHPGRQAVLAGWVGGTDPTGTRQLAGSRGPAGTIVDCCC